MITNFNRKNYIIIIFSFILIIFFGGLFFLKNTSDKPVLSKSNEKVDKYTIDVILEDEVKRLKCNQNISYINNADEELESLYFHIYPNAFSKEIFTPFEKSHMSQAYPNGFNEGYISIENIIIDEKKVDYKIEGEKDDILKIKLNKPLMKKESISIDMKFNIKLPNSYGRFGYGEDTINITNWFPIACVYDKKGWNTKSYEIIGDPFYSDMSDFKVNILAPSKYIVGSTGRIIESKTDNKKSLYSIEANNVRDFALILSDRFTIKKDKLKDIEIVTYNLNPKFSKVSTQIAKDSIEIFSEMFGDYPYDIYSVVASDFYIGGMEYPTLSMIDKSLYTNKNKFLLEYVIAHETAHQWWYAIVGNDEVNEPWIDEALTEYSTILYFEKKYGKEYLNRLIENMESQSKSYLNENIFKPSNKYKNSTDYGLNVYTKGAVLFHKIREEVGDELFFNVLKKYYDTYKFKNVDGVQFVELWKSNGVDIKQIIETNK